LSALDAFCVFLLSLLPYFEGRYALLIGIALGLSLRVAVATTLLGTLLLSIALPAALGRLDALLATTNVRPLRRLYDSVIDRARRETKRYARASLPALVAFVAVPLPGTGVWTGSLIAYLLGLPKRTAIPVLACGGVLSVAIVAIAYKLGAWTIEGFAFR